MRERGRQLPLSGTIAGLRRNLAALPSIAACVALSLAVTLAAQDPTGPQIPIPQPPAPAPQQAPQKPPADQQAPSQPQAPLQPQTPSSAPAQAPPASAPAAEPQPAANAPAPVANATRGEPSDVPGITEDELRQQLQGKTFFLRGGYLDNTLHFDDNGVLGGNSPQASYTLSLVEITRVRLDKKHLELEGVRYGLHFLGALPSEDQTSAYDKVRLTTKKKPLRITIDREEVVKPKKEKENKKKGAPPKGGSAAAVTAPGAAGQAAAPAPLEIGRHGVTVTISQDHANRALRRALDRIFSAGIDSRMISTLPDYWQLYYKSVTTKQEFRPDDPAVLRETQVDRRARLLSVFEPPSNEYAQNNGVAGMALYRVVVKPDGTPGQIAVARPIGFGLDENAVDAIRKAKFEPAMKDGKPVPVLLDLVVQFRIYSKRTAAVASASARPAEPEGPVLPGPYSVSLPKPQ